MNGEFVPRIVPRAPRKIAPRLSHYETLKEAIQNRDRGTIIWLLNEGCPVNEDTNQNSETPLHVAVLVADIDVARILLSAGAKIDAVNNQKQTPLHLAFEMGEFEMVDLLLPYCDGKSNPFTVYGLSHFHIACVRNNWNVANSFLLRGVNANMYLEKCFYAKDYVYYRPLHLAVEYENLEVAELLLRYGANVDATDRYKRTPLHLACRYNYTRIREAENEEELIDVIKSESYQPELVKLLLRYHADIEALDSNGTPPLLHVFKCNYRKIRTIVNEKIKGGTLSNEFWNNIVTRLRAIQREKFNILIQRDGDVKYKCPESKETLLHMVIDGKKLSPKAKEYDLEDEERAIFVDLLCKYGADIEAKNSNNQTPLQLAIALYHSKTVKTLINNYANVSKIRFVHYKIPKREPSFDLFEMENFLDSIGLILRRKFDLNISWNNELLMLRYLALDSSVRHLENCSVTDLRHLLDFGDVNSMTFCATERSVLDNREKVILVLQHIRKLELAGLSVDERIKNEFDGCQRIFDADRQAFDDDCKEEIERMKIIMIDRYASFYDLLFVNVNEIAVRMKNEDFRRVVRTNCDDRLNMYRNIIAKQFVKGLVRSILLDLAKEYLNVFVRKQLPDPCSESILSHLQNEDLCNLLLAFE